MSRRHDASTPELPCEVEIDHLLEVASAPGSPNHLSVANLRDLVLEHLDEYDLELARFPELADRPHSNLWMIDVQSHDARFVALLFRRDVVEFCCGTGDAMDIKQFAEDEFPTDDSEVFPALIRRFRTPENTVRLERQEAQVWLGRGW